MLWCSLLYINVNHLKMKIMASGPITSWAIDGETVGTVADLFFKEHLEYIRAL